MYDQRIVIVSPREVVDEYSYGTTYVFDEDSPTRPVPFGVEVQPRMTEETDRNGRRTTIRSGWSILSPPGRVIVVGARERIRWAGHPEDLDVIGDSAVWDHPTLKHSELDVEATRG